MLSGDFSGRISLFGLVMQEKIWKHLEHFCIEKGNIIMQSLWSEIYRFITL